MSVTCNRSVVFSTDKTDRHDITEILLKGTGTFNTIKPNHPFTDDQIQKILIKCHQNGHHAAILTFPRKYIVCIKHYFTTNYKLMISNHLQVTGGSYQNINMVAVQPSWIAHASALYFWSFQQQNCQASPFHIALLNYKRSASNFN